MLKTILVISGKPGLYKLISRGSHNLIVETVDAQKKRMPVFSSERVVSLGDISIYTDNDDEIKLSEVFENIAKEYKSKAVDLSPKKAPESDIVEFFTKALPNYDKDRVRINDMRKVLSWYNMLIGYGMTEFVEKQAEEVKEKAEEKTETEVAKEKEKKTKAPSKTKKTPKE